MIVYPQLVAHMQNLVIRILVLALMLSVFAYALGLGWLGGALFWIFGVGMAIVIAVGLT